MKQNVEVRPNGVVIEKIKRKGMSMYYVGGSKNGPWDYLSNARRDADDLDDYFFNLTAINQKVMTKEEYKSLVEGKL